MGWWPAIRHSKDPANFIVLFEDSAALAGLVVAAIGVWTSHYFNDPRLDGIASIIIGIILALVATLLARESKGLLIGERADRSEEHTSELQSLMRISYAVFCLKNKKTS